MEFLSDLPGRHAVAALLGLVGAWAGIRGARLFVLGVRHADHESASLWVVRGIRGVVFAVGAGALAVGLLYAQAWLLVFGVIFIAEELYETGVVALILRRDRHRRETLPSR